MLEFILGVFFVLILNRLLNRKSLGRGALRKRYASFHGRKDGIVVFVIGTKLNSWFSVLQAVKHLPSLLQYLKYAKNQFGNIKMLREEGMLESHQAGGLIGILFGAGSINVQYWKSHEDLVRYSNKKREHVDSMRQYYKEIEELQIFSIWHETYIVHHEYEAVYGSSRRFGLAAIPDVISIDVNKSSAALKTGMGRMEHAMKNEI
jgi:hypothetical protein